MITKHTYVGGQPRPSGLEHFDKRYPATGEVIAKIEPTSLEQLDEVIAEAAEAQKAWAALSGTERGRVLLRAAKILQDRNEALSRVEVMDVGKAIAEAMPKCPNLQTKYKPWLYHLLKDEQYSK